MIRDFRKTDLEPVLDIWLCASIKAHHFIKPEFWRNQLDAMREVYLPGSISRVFEKNGLVVGFCSLHGDFLAALFVSPEQQGTGIGTQLLRDAMKCKSVLELTVYSANSPSIRFYENQGFEMLEERLDERTGQPEKLMRWAK